MSRYVANNIGKLLEEMGQRRNGKVALPHGISQLPFDYPAYIEVGRVLGLAKDKRCDELLGHIVTLYAYAAGNVVEIKHFRNPSGIEILVDGERVFYNRPKKRSARAIDGMKKYVQKMIVNEEPPETDVEVFDDDDIE